MVSPPARFVVVRALIAGAELQSLILLADQTLSGEIKPVTDYKGWLPPDFYTHWEPGYEERDDLPRRDRVRSMAAMYHHHPGWQK